MGYFQTGKLTLLWHCWPLNTGLQIGYRCVCRSHGTCWCQTISRYSADCNVGDDFIKVTLAISDFTHVMTDQTTAVTCRDQSGHGLSQWEKTLRCNIVSHWLSPYPELSLHVTYELMQNLVGRGLLTFWGFWDTIAVILQTFSNSFFLWNLLYSYSNFIEFFSWWSNLQW